VRGQIFICEYLANSALCKLFELHTDCAEGLIEGARIIWLRVLHIAAVPPAKTNFSGKKINSSFFHSVEFSFLAKYKQDFSNKTNWWKKNCVLQLIIQEK